MGNGYETVVRPNLMKIGHDLGLLLYETVNRYNVQVTLYNNNM